MSSTWLPKNNLEIVLHMVFVVSEMKFIFFFYVSKQVWANIDSMAII